MGKTDIFSILPHSQNYSSSYIFDALNVFIDHEHIGIEPQFIVLLYAVQKVQLFAAVWQNDIIFPYLSKTQTAITFEPYIVEQYFFALHLCFHGLRTHLKNLEFMKMNSSGSGAKWTK